MDKPVEVTLTVRNIRLVYQGGLRNANSAEGVRSIGVGAAKEDARKPAAAQPKQADDLKR